MKVVLDTSALFYLGSFGDEVEMHAPPGVMDELEKYNDNRVPYLCQVIAIASPGEEAMEEVEMAAIETGDRSRLSQVDREVIGLALEIGGKIFTDDYSIQNMARFLGIEYETVGQEGIKKIFKWKLKCTSCGRVLASQELNDCPICGGNLRSFRSWE